MVFWRVVDMLELYDLAGAISYSEARTLGRFCKP